MKLTYWVCECLNDGDVYNIREKTRKAAVALSEEYGGHPNYGPPIKVTVEYRDGFDLLQMALGESRIAEEARALWPD